MSQFNCFICFPEKRREKMKAYKEIRKLLADDLRLLCIQEEWYLYGNNDEYNHLLYLTQKNHLTADDIAEIVLDIMAHSELNDDDFEYVSYMVLKLCHTSIHKLDHEQSDPFAHETNPEEAHDGAQLTHWVGDSKPLTIDAGGLKALEEYYSNHKTDLD